MFIYEIVLNTEFESVFRILKRNYGIENGYEYENLYSRLKDMNPTSIGLLTIYINAYRQSDEDSIFIEDFDENDTSLYKVRISRPALTLLGRTASKVKTCSFLVKKITDAKINGA